MLLFLIYLSFISLGLPDSVLGSAWPVIQPELGVSVSAAGLISMIVSCGTVISSFLSVRMIKKMGTGPVTFISVGLTALALLGVSMTKSYAVLCILAVPLGLGAGAVDAALNNFVALHYEAKHMNWLHCFWGIGATAGPMILSLWLQRGSSWRMGYLTIGLLQSILVLFLLFSLPLWKKQKKGIVTQEEKIATISLRKITKVPYAIPVLIGLFCYSSLELTTGLWAGSFAVKAYQVSAETAAIWTSVYYFGITFGRLLAGFLSMKFTDRQLITIGQGIIVLGIILLLLPLPVEKIPIGMALIGLGCAPIYPSMLHQTPAIFGVDLSQSMMGIQMAFAYTGSTLMPPLFGVLAEWLDISLLPIYLLVVIAIMIICERRIKERRSFSK